MRTMSRFGLVLPVLAGLACGQTTTSEPVAASAQVAPVGDPLCMLKDRHGQTAEQVARALELAPSKSFEDLVDLGTAYVWLGEWNQAAEAYEVAARNADSPQKEAIALYGKAVALAYGGHLDEGRRTADVASRVMPENREVAWLRLALHQRANDAVGVMLARDHVQRVDPDARGKEVFEPITAVVVGGVSIVAIAAVTSVVLVEMVPPEDRAEVVVPMFQAFAGICVGREAALPIPLGDASMDLGRKLVAETI